DSSRPAADEGLPDYEPLTPELVEDEAVRGDFMLRWSVILLAVLLGWTEVSESLTLVRIKSGQYLASHGWLPPQNDVFSVTAADQPWLNFSWLGDLLLAGVHGLGGDVALTVLAALLAGVSFWCVSSSARTGVSTWWSSICTVLAAIAAFPLLRPGPDSVAVLGLSLTMLLLMKGEEKPDRARYVLLVPLMWLWSNLDGHAFLGAALLLSYAIGDAFDSRRSGIGGSGKVWMFALAGIAVMFVHPFHVNVARAVQLLYVVEPSQQLQYAGEGREFAFLWRRLADRQVWQNLNVFALAGVLTAVAAILAMGLNRRHVRISHLLVWVAMLGLALISMHALAAAAVVNAVLASVNGQEWYRRSFRQNYSVESAELLFSRGGRAITVIGLFALAYLAVSGRLMGADGRRIGMGWDDEIATSVASYKEVVADSYDDRAFNFLPMQGDVLIWNGQKPFVDSRLGMYGSANPNIAELHRKVRLALRQRVAGDERTGQRSVWRDAFEKYQVSHALPRLSGRRPDYETFFDLVTDPEREWQLVHLGAATAALYHVSPTDKSLSDYLQAHRGADFLRQAFPTDLKEDPAALPPLAPPREPTWYDRVLILPQDTLSNDVQLARHYVQLRSLLANRIPADISVSLSMLAIRHARKGLASDPNSADAYHALAASYLGLSEFERYLDSTGQAVGPMRIRQALASLHHAAVCNPDDANVQMTLFQVLLSLGKPDLALPHLLEVERITGSLTTATPDSEAGREEAERNRELKTQLSTQIETVTKELRQSLLTDEKDNNRMDVVQSALNRGLPGEALRLLEEDQTVVAQNTNLQMLVADLELDAGRTDDAVTQLESLSAIMLQQNPTVAGRWRNATALANIAAGNYERARTLLTEDIDAATSMRLQAVIGTSPAPISTVPFTHAPSVIADVRALTRTTLFADLLFGYPQQINRDQFMLAACDLEDGRNIAAAERLDEVLVRDPEADLRTTVVFYLSALNDRAVEFARPSESIPVWGGMFADDAEGATTSAAETPTESPETNPAPESEPVNDTPAGDDAGSPTPPPASERREAGDAP
ncbi:MAG: hypothetical protein JNG89_09900, partial [Planctomycetaceae bacterium]|nr:hypothetical protein [Planctomycetaceae bacterium]